MLNPLVAALFAVAPLPPCAPSAGPPAVRADSTLVALYESGQPFDVFLAEVKERRATWLGWSETGEIPAEILADVAGLAVKLRVLVVAIDGCSDSANSVPWIARLVAGNPSIELRIVKPDAGKAAMEAHRTPDGRAATPTVIVLDEAGNNAGCWVERPAVLQQMAIDARAAGTLEEYQRTKQAWYDEDQGVSILREVAAVLRGAGSGTPVCSAKLGQ